MTSRVDEMLEAARARLRRLHAHEVPAAVRRGAVLVDIRPAAQRETEGALPAALVIERNVLEWRCDPTSEARLPQAVDDDVEWVVLCSEGYTSSLAAASLRDLGLHRATDIVGGYRSLAETRVLEQLPASPARKWSPPDDIPNDILVARRADMRLWWRIQAWLVALDIAEALQPRN